MASPLGKYSDLVAAITAVSIVGAYIVVLVAGALLGLDPDQSATNNLKDIAFIAVGAVFTLGGKSQGANGTKAIAEAAHARLDAMGAPPATG